MTEPTYETLITDLTEIEIRGTDDVPIYISKPYFERVRVKHAMFTATNYFGKRRSSYTFRSDDIVIALQTIHDGGEEKEIAKALATNVIWAQQLYKHCVKLVARIKKSNKKVTNKSVSNKKVINQKVKGKTNQKVKDVIDLKVDLNKDINIKLNNWM